ncbi:hypothetical protein ABEB36_006607 [Hypothenemus hampei]|uniref:Uncharacterized protein n=1 Tax=Hypothenemus hampei TaxID=57062 RepID=A0ABD1ERM6_HYPHA
MSDRKKLSSLTNEKIEIIKHNAGQDQVSSNAVDIRQDESNMAISVCKSAAEREVCLIAPENKQGEKAVM